MMEIIVEIPSEHKKIHFYCSSCQTPEQVAQKAFGVLGNLQSEATLPCGGVGIRWSQEIPYSLSNPVIL